MLPTRELDALHCATHGREMTHLGRWITLLIIAVAFAAAARVEAGQDRYAAIAFSPSTGQYGYGNGFRTKAEAVERALEECGADDAITRWTRNAWIALAISDETRTGYGWGAAWAKTESAARALARRKCLQNNDEAHVVICISAYR